MMIGKNHGGREGEAMVIKSRERKAQLKRISILSGEVTFLAEVVHEGEEPKLPLNKMAYCDVSIARGVHYNTRDRTLCADISNMSMDVLRSIERGLKVAKNKHMQTLGVQNACDSKKNKKGEKK